MSGNERLREILIEVQDLRAREAQALAETNALLDMLEVVTTAAHPREAMQAFLGQVATSLKAEAVAILRIEDGTHLPVAQWPDKAGLGPFDPPTSLGRKFRSFVDLHDLEKWSNCLPGPHGAARSLVSVPVSHPDGTPGAIMCLHARPDQFSAADAHLLRRLRRFAAQILETLQLSTQNALLAAVIDGSSSGFAIADAQKDEMPLVFVNQAFESMTGYTAAEVLGQNCRFLTADAPDAPERTRLRAAVAAREEGVFLLRNRRKSGAPFWNNLTLFPVRDETGAATHMVATQIDATERVALEDAQRDAQARLEVTLAHTNDAFLLVIGGETVGFSNPALQRLFPAPGLNWAEGSRFRDNWHAYLAAIPTAQRPTDTAFLEPDILQLTENDAGQRLHLPDGRQVLVRADNTEEGDIVISATDITSLRNTERLLRQRAVAVERASDGIAIADAKGRIIYANTSLTALFGAQGEAALVGRKWRSFYTDDTAQIPAAARVSDGGGSVRALRKPQDDNAFHEVTQTFVEKVGEVAVIRNVTARVRMLERQAELDAQLERSRRREAISQLAAGLAHDFNNLLSTINGSALLIGMEDDTSDDVRAHAGRISRAGNQAARLVNRLLDLGASSENDGVFDLRAVLREAEDLVATSLAPGLTLRVSVPDDPVLITGQTGDVAQVLVNLILNANDAYLAETGHVDVAVTTEVPHMPDGFRVGALQPDHAYARLTVRDTGCGMTDETQARVFEPYFSTKGSAGTGIGLPMVATIVERSGGAIALRSDIGAGTQFDLFWPLSGTEQIEDLDIAPDSTLSGLTVLLLDDDTQVTDVLSAYLEQHGAEVVALQDPELAVETLLEDGDAWAALITDYDMPEMSGGDVIQQVRAGGCTVPIYVATALARRLKDPRINAQSVSEIFAKPLDLRQLVQRLASDLAPTNEADS